MKNKSITSREEDYSQWYLDVVETGELAENSIVRGCMVIRGNGFAIWENIKDFLDRRIKETGHKNVYFPIFIPKSLLSREASHVKGFAKECAVVTHYRLIENEAGDGVVVDPEAKLEEELIVRPTSETIMYETYKNWVNSWRDLPLLYNQWNNVVRWEMRTRPFLRTTEFLWQEGHTAHATEEEAKAEVAKMLEVYRELAEEMMAIPVIAGVKSVSERFAGADDTHTIEAMMQDGKALQSGTSHNLGQNFAKAFDVKFADRDGTEKYVWQTSWGLSTRIIGALIMSHSDDKGLVLPPRIAPTQVAIVPIWKEESQETVLGYADGVNSALREAGMRVEYDTRDYESPGSKFNEWEKMGVPLRIEIGLRDIESNQVVFVRRDTGEKIQIDVANVAEEAGKILETIQKDLYDRAAERLKANTFNCDSYEEFKNILTEKRGFIKAFWCEDAKCEEAIKNETKATTRCLPLNSVEEKGSCVYCGKEAKNRWIFALSY